MEGLYEQSKSWTTEPKGVERPAQTQKQDIYFTQALKRQRDFEQVFRLGLQLGAIEKRGTSHLYFNGKYLGNGECGVCLQITADDYELESEIRMAVKTAANGKGSGSSREEAPAS